MKLALVALLTVACSPRSGPPENHAPSSPTSSPPPTSKVVVDGALLVTALVEDWTSTRATMRLWHRDHRGWQATTEPWPAVIGAKGSAWGAGLHGVGAPAGRAGPVKREGDKKNPAGVFSLRGAYGYTSSSAGGTLPYRQLTDAWKCVDDPTSHAYNRILDATTTTKDWSSAEDMRRKDALYTWVIDVAHNAERKPGAGSCIFLHVWDGPNSTTLGCTAMQYEKLESLIEALDARAQPAFVLLPRGEYEALAGTWDLPPI